MEKSVKIMWIGGVLILGVLILSFVNALSSKDDNSPGNYSIDPNIASASSLQLQMDLLRNGTSNYILLNESSFTMVSTGNGWVGKGNEKSLARISLTERIFINSSSKEETKFGRGFIKISDQIYSLRLHSSIKSTNTYDIVDDQENTHGTLVLTQRTSLFGFAAWKGSMELESGEIYDVEIATLSQIKISADDISKEHIKENTTMTKIRNLFQTN